MLKITPSTIIGKKNTIRRIPQIVKLPLNLSVIISIVLFIYLNIRINTTVGNFFLNFFYPLLPGGETVKRIGIGKRFFKRVSTGCLDGSQNGSLMGFGTGF